MEKRSRGIYFHFLLRALPILIIPVLLMAFAYYRNLKAFKQEVYSKNAAIIQNNAKLVESTVNSVSGILNYLQENTAVSGFLSYESLNEDGTNTEAVNRLQKDIRSLVISNEIIDDIHIYSKKNQMLIHSTSAVVNLDRFYNHNFKIKGMDYEEWVEQVLIRQGGKGAQFIPFRKEGDTNQYLLFGSDLPMNTGEYSKGSVSVFLNETMLFQSFENIEYQDGGYILVQNEEGDILYQDNRTGETVLPKLEKMTGGDGYFVDTVQGQELFVTYYVDRNGWSYMAAIPRRLAEGAVRDNSIYLIIMLAFALLVGIFMIHFFTTRLSRPITRIYSMIKNDQGKMSYGEFEDTVERMVMENREMQKELDKQIPALKTSIFHTLLVEGYQTREETTERLQWMGVDVTSHYFVILIVSMNDLPITKELERIAAQKICLKDLLRESLNVGQIYDLDYEKIGILCESDCPSLSEAKANCESRLRKIEKQLEERLSISLSFYGDITDDLEEIPLCFNRMIEIMGREGRLSSGMIQWYDTRLEESREGFWYPAEVEERIIDSVLLGKKEELECIMERIRQHNEGVGENGGRDGLREAFCRSLKRIFELDPQLHTPHAQKKWERLKSDHGQEKENTENLDGIRDFLEELAAKKREGWNEKNTEWKYKLENYIEMHYRDPQISLSAAAEHFGLSEVYLSRLFKQIFGQNFSKYVERMRMDAAKQMIDEGKWRISDIADQVGYNSAQSFRRAYKRIFGCTPRER